MPKQNRVITLRVELDGIEPSIWRQIAVDGDITLRALHHVIQAAFGWTDAHLHEFNVEGYTYAMLDNEHVLEGDLNDDDLLLDDRKPKLHRLLYAGQCFTYLYDFGDNWAHKIRVVKIEQRPEPMGSACIIDGGRACPPEDVGGIGGYGDFLTTIREEPGSEAARECLSWIGGNFDSEGFDKRLGKKVSRSQHGIDVTLTYIQGSG